MKATPIPLFVFALALLGLMTLAVAQFTPAEPQTHSQFSTMQVGGNRAADDSEHWMFGLMFGWCVIANLLAFLWLGTDGKRHAGSLQILLCLGGVLFAVVYLVMMLAFGDYVGDRGPTMLGYFPNPATWMIFGVWFMPVFFIAVYSFGFHRWFHGGGEVDRSDQEGTVD